MLKEVFTKNQTLIDMKTAKQYSKAVSEAASEFHFYGAPLNDYDRLAMEASNPDEFLELIKQHHTDEGEAVDVIDWDEVREFCHAVFTKLDTIN